MIYVLKDDADVVGLIANLEETQIAEAVRKVDYHFRHLVDMVPFNDLDKALCEAVGVPYESTIEGWQDVLMAYLVDLGGTLVEYREIDAVPDGAQLGVD